MSIIFSKGKCSGNYDDWWCEVLFRDDETIATSIDTMTTEDIPSGSTFSEITVQSQVIYNRKTYTGIMFDVSSPDDTLEEVIFRRKPVEKSL